MKKFIVTLIFLVSLLPGKTRFLQLYIHDQEFRVEIADTWEQRVRGMMFRKVMAENFGMLLVFDTESIQGIWMKNCLVHMDIIFLDKKQNVVDMYLNVPPCSQEPCETYVSKKPAMYVLEIKGNRASELNLKVGEHITFYYSK